MWGVGVKVHNDNVGNLQILLDCIAGLWVWLGARRMSVWVWDVGGNWLDAEASGFGATAVG